MVVELRPFTDGEAQIVVGTVLLAVLPEDGGDVVVGDELPHGVVPAVHEPHHLLHIADGHVEVAELLVDGAELLVETCAELRVVIGEDEEGVLQRHHAFHGLSVAEVADHSLPVIALGQLRAVVPLQFLHGGRDDGVEAGREALRHIVQKELRLGLGQQHPSLFLVRQAATGQYAVSPVEDGRCQFGVVRLLLYLPEGGVAAAGGKEHDCQESDPQASVRALVSLLVHSVRSVLFHSLQS